MTRFFAIIFLSIAITGSTQDSIPSKKRLNVVRYGGLATYAVGMVGLNELWYSQTPRTSFHFFNDAAEWKQVDKAGHVFTAFHLSNTTYKALTWAGSKERNRVMVSTLVGFVALSSIEVFDGFSTSYGASVTDLAANATGSLLFMGQMMAWKEIRIQPKFSFSPSSMAALRPDVLGSNYGEELLKDYNGQTYWLSVDMDKFMRFPKWLNLATGYGANQMKYARDSENIAEGFYPKRQFYLSVDFDLTAIRTKSKLLKGIIYFVNMVKIPAPTLEFSKTGVRAHVLYF